MAESLARWQRIDAVAAVLACALPLALTMPGPVQGGLALLGALGAASAWRSPLHAAVRVPLVLATAGMLLVAFGFRPGRDAGSALLLSMLLLKLGELTALRDAQRVSAFALFAPFAAFLQDQGPLTLLLALPASGLALRALHRLVAPPSVPWPASGLGLLLASALPLALAGYWLFPRLATPLWGVPQNATSRPGIDDRMTPGDWADIFGDDSPAFTVRFEGASPPQSLMYWRGPVLTIFDGRTWRPSERTTRLPPPPQAANPQWRYTLTAEPSERRWLFALEAVASLPTGEAALDGDGVPRLATPLRTARQFKLAAAPTTPAPVALDPIQREAALQLPAGYNPRTLTRARAWRAEADSDAAYIRRILQWFNADLSYSLGVKELGTHTADEFLFDARIGFCEHFSSAFVILMRGGGIPARVVTGYAGGTPNPYADFWVVRQMDAHAWSEVWLEDKGWVRIDPTAAVAPENVFETLESRRALGDVLGLRPVFDAGDVVRQLWSDFVIGFNAARQAELLRPLGIERADREQIVAAFVLMSALSIAMAVWLLLRETGVRRDPLEKAWRQMQARLARHGFQKDVHESAQAFLARVAQARPWEAERLAALSRDFVSLQYAAGGDTPARRAALLADLLAYRPTPMP